MNKQEAFNKVWDWFVVQKKPLAVDPVRQTCAYRGPNETKCAAGVLLPDEMCKGYNNSALCTLPGVKDFLGEAYDLAEVLQKAHDGGWVAARDGWFTKYMQDKLKGIAEDYNLTLP